MMSYPRANEVSEAASRGMVFNIRQIQEKCIGNRNWIRTYNYSLFIIVLTKAFPNVSVSLWSIIEKLVSPSNLTGSFMMTYLSREFERGCVTDIFCHLKRSAGRVAASGLYIVRPTFVRNDVLFRTIALITFATELMASYLTLDV